MSDIAKWALLIAGAIALIALIVALPFVQFIDLSAFSDSVADIVNIAGEYLQSGRGLINCFLSDVGIAIVSGMLVYWFGKWAILTAIKIGTWIYHFIFK